MALAALGVMGCGGGGGGGSGGNENRAPTTSNVAATLNEDAAATAIAITATDPDNDTLTLTIVTAPTRGTATAGASAITYTPNANQNGTDQIAFRVTDPGGLSANGTVTITITPQVDAPVVQGGTIDTIEDEAGAITVTATDIDDTVLTASLQTPPARGTVAITGTNPFTFTYTPTQDLNGADSFAFVVADAGGGEAVGNVTVNVAAVPDAPTIPALSIVTPEDTPTNGVFGATDPDGNPDAVMVSVETGPSHGSLIINGSQYSYSPDQDYSGADSFSLVGRDPGDPAGLVSEVVVVPVTVNAVNDIPLAVADVAQIAATGPSDIDVAANDSDVEDTALSVEIVTQPPGATATVVNNTLRVTPGAGAIGPTSLTYQVRDSGGATATASVRIVIGDPMPLFLLSTTGGKRVYRYDYLSQPVDLALPVPASETLEHFVTSANGAWLVYVTRLAGLPIQDRLWLKNLDDLTAPVTEIAPGTNHYNGFPLASYLAVSPNGSHVVFNNSYLQTGAPGVVSDVETGLDIAYPTFTRDSQRLYYTVLLAGGGRIIKRADIAVNGALTNHLQMTADYPVGEGLGSTFVLTPDETRIVSTGQLFVGGAVNGLRQHAYVTTADGSRDDTPLHPPFVNFSSGASLPLVTADSRYGLYDYMASPVQFSLMWAHLEAPGTNTVSIMGAINPYSAMRVAGDSRHGFVEDSAPTLFRWSYFRIEPSQALGAFNPVGGGVAPPRDVMPAPDGSAVVFDGGAGVYATLGGQFTVATLLFSRPVSTEPTILSAPDSASVAVTDLNGAGTYVGSHKAPGWFEALTVGGAAITTSCVAYAGQGC